MLIFMYISFCIVSFNPTWMDDCQHRMNLQQVHLYLKQCETVMLDLPHWLYWRLQIFMYIYGAYEKCLLVTSGFSFGARNFSCTLAQHSEAQKSYLPIKSVFYVLHQAIFTYFPTQPSYCILSSYSYAVPYVLSIAKKISLKTLHQYCQINSGAPVAQGATKRSPIRIWETKGNPWVDFLMVIMASGIAHGRIRTMATTTTTTMTESCKKAAILQIMGWQRHVVYCVPIWYWTSMLWSIDPVKIRYPLTSIMWSYRGLKFTAHWGQVFFWSWLLTKCCCFFFFNWIVGLCLVNLLKTGQDCSEAG